MISIVELIDHQKFIPTIVSWIQKEWPAGDHKDDFSVRQRLCGSLIPNKLPLALVARSDENVIGFISMINHPLSSSKEVAQWIDTLFVDSAYRGRGIGVQLLQTMEEKASSLSIKTLYVFTSKISFYERAGWAVLASQEINPGKEKQMSKLLLEK